MLIKRNAIGSNEWYAQAASELNETADRIREFRAKFQPKPKRVDEPTPLDLVKGLALLFYGFLCFITYRR